MKGMISTAVVHWFFTYKYFVLFGVAFLEGPVIMTLSGLLVRLGHTSLWPTYCALTTGDLLADAMWYWIGYFFARPLMHRYGRFFSLTPALLTKTQTLYKKYHANILFFSKLTMGFGFSLVVLMTAGMSRVPFRKYLLLNAAGEVLWAGGLMSVGYFFGSLYTTINTDLQYVSIGAFTVVCGAVIYGVGRAFRARHVLEKTV